MQAKIAGILIAAATILTACADTPDNLLESSSNLGEESSSEDHSAIERQISLEELRNNKEQLAEEICDDSYDNLKFQSGLSFVVPDEIGKYHVILPDHFQDNAQKLFDKYIPEDMYDESKIIDDLTTYPLGPYFMDEETGFYVGVGCNGAFYYDSGIDHSLYTYSDEFEFASYYIPSGTFSGNSMIAEEDANAVRVAQDFADDFTDYISYSNELDVATLSKFEREDYSDLYIAYLQNIYKGLRVFNIMSTHDDLSFEIGFVPDGYVYLDSEYALEGMSALGVFEDFKTIEAKEEIISPKWAARALSDQLSSFLNYNVIGIDLAYVPVFIENVEKEMVGTDIHVNASARASYNVYELTPYWIFYFDVTPDKQVLGMVNCIDGSVEFMNNAR